MAVHGGALDANLLFSIAPVQRMCIMIMIYGSIASKK